MDTEKNSNRNLYGNDRLYKDTPWGMIYLSSDRFPKVLFANKVMLDDLMVDENSEEWNDFIKENFFMALPPSDRTRFRAYLDEALSSGRPVMIEHGCVRPDGTEKELSGILQKVTNDGMETEFCIIYLPESKEKQNDRARERSFLNVLRKAYDIIIEADSKAHTVSCIYSREIKGYGAMPSMQLVYEGALDYLVENYIVEEDRAHVRELVVSVVSMNDTSEGNIPATGFRMQYKNGLIRDMRCDIIKLDDRTLFICCRDITRDRRASDSAEAQKAEKLKRLAAKNTGVYIKTFGIFDVFIDGKPMAFRNEKAKELLAILVDRRGGFVDSSYAIGCLWPGEELTKTLQVRYRQTALRLNNALKDNGIDEIVENDEGHRRLVPEKVKCDLLDFYDGTIEEEDNFKGAYLIDYPWAETTRKELMSY